MTRPAQTTQKTIQVLIVDDSRVGRAVIGKILHELSPQVKIVGYAEDGNSALEALDVCDPDIVILDLAMPSMDGMTALPLILKKKPEVRVVVCSALTPPGTEMSVKALFLGATACIPKPSGTKDAKAFDKFKASLNQAVLGLYALPQTPLTKKAPVNPVPASSFRPKILAIGSSTGGPNALMKLLKETGPLPVPVLITQHVMANFTSLLAQQVQHETGLPCLETREGMTLEPSKIYIAASGSHLRLKRVGHIVTASLDDGPPENFCKPSVDVMLRSAAEIYGRDVMTVILTGMGKDGLEGCKEVFKAGGRIIVQDQESSVVWGMPGCVASEGLASAVMPLPDMAKKLRQIFADKNPVAGAS